MENQPQYNYRRSNSGRIFWGIFLSLLIFAIVFMGFSFLFFAKVVSGGRNSNEYSYESSGRGKGKVAVVDLDYTIISSDAIVRQFKEYREDKSIKAIVLRINSPGGGVAASQEMYEAIKKTRDSGKPVVVSFSSLAASGGYYAACGGSTIVSEPGSLTGSIGVIINLTNFKELAQKIGVSQTIIKSGELKDAGNPFRDVNEKDRAYFQDIVDDSFDQFLQVVSKERKIDMDSLRKIATGRVFTGRQALTLKLVDKIGTFDDAVMLAAKMGGIDGEPTLVKEKEKYTLIKQIIEGTAPKNDVSSDIHDIKELLKNEILEQPLLQYKFVR